MEEPAIASIRRATRDQHATLEAILRLGPPLSSRRYLDALRGFELFLSVWEPRIDAALPPPLRPWFVSRSRRDLVQRDLTQLDSGHVAQEAIIRACEHAVSEIDLAGTAGVFGSMYVLEGSLLGGQVIAKMACETLGLDRAYGAAYFNGPNKHAATRWTSFQRLLEKHVGTEQAAHQQACSAARKTFDALTVTFTCLCRDLACN